MNAQREFERLKPGLLDEDEDTRFEVGCQIARLGRPVVPLLIELTREPNPMLRQMACFMLREVGEPPEPWNRIYPDGIPHTVKLLQSDPVADVRAAAASALGFHKDRSTIPALIEASRVESDEVRFDVACALGSFYEETWEEMPDSVADWAAVAATLLQLMDDEDEDVRDWATFGIHQGGHDTPAIRKRLWQALDDPNCDVRGEAAFALAKFGDRSLIPRLIELLDQDTISPCYFEAAETLNDPALLPAVKATAEEWRKIIEPDDSLHLWMDSAIETLSKDGKSRSNSSE